MRHFHNADESRHHVRTQFLLAGGLARQLMCSVFIWDGVRPAPAVDYWVSIAVHLLGGAAIRVFTDINTDHGN